MDGAVAQAGFLETVDMTAQTPAGSDTTGKSSATLNQHIR